MSVTSQLLKVFRVDKQLRGLRSRLDAAERFLAVQQGALREIDEKKGAIDLQVKQLRASGVNDEGEAALLETKMATLRDQMNAAKTAKEYNAFLSELNHFKESKTSFEETALEAMGKVEQLEQQATELGKQRAERARMVANAEADRKTKEAEIKDRVAELTAQRVALAAGIPAETIKTLELLIKQRGDDAMASVEVLDRRNHEYSCTACMMTLPVETVSAMLSGRLTRCVSCSSILFTEEDLLAVVPKAAKAPKAPKTGKQVAKT
jgi:predicted  nucleic acid-binding Zn-ribbon protein